MNNLDVEAVAKIDEAIQNLKTVLLEHLSMSSSSPSSEEIYKIVAERKELAESLGLVEKLLAIWEEIRFYPNIAKREGWLERRKFSIDSPEFVQEDNNSMSFTFLGKPYSLSMIKKDKSFTDTYSRDDFYERKYPHELYLRKENGDLLLAIKVYRVVDEVGSFFKADSLIGFVPGDWIGDFLPEYEKMKALHDISKKQFQEKVQHEKLERMKNNFGIE